MSTFVQGAAGSSTTSAVATSFAAANTSGNFLIAIAAVLEPFGGAAAMTIADSQGNTWTPLSGPPAELNNFLPGVWVCSNANPGANTVTVTYGSGGRNIAAVVLEFADLLLPDVHAVAEGASVSSVTTSITTTLPGDILIGLGTFQASAIGPATNSSGYTSDLAVIEFPGTANSMSFGVFETVAGAAGPYSLSAGSGFFIYGYLYLLAFTGTPPPPPPPPPTAWLVINEPSIGLTDRTSYLFKGEGTQHNFSLELRQRGQASIHLYVAAGDTYAPTRGTPVFLYDQMAAGPFLVWAGLIQDIENQWLGRAGDHYVIITAVSLESVFDTVYAPPYQYVNETCGFIVADLLSRLETGCPVTAGTISAGAVIPLLNTNYEKISDIFDELATASSFTWGVDPATQTLFFQTPDTIAAPFTLNETDILWDTVDWKQTGADYRNRQAIRLASGALGHSSELFTGTGQLDFTLMRPVNQVTNAWITLSTQNTALGAFSGQPSPGDTVTIGVPPAWVGSHIYGLGGVIIDPNGYVQAVTGAGTSGGTIPVFDDVTTGTTVDNTVIWTCLGPAGISTGIDVYTFVTALDNTQFGQVLIGATTAATCQNLIDTINAMRMRGGVQLSGVTYSLPTWECTQCNAVDNTGTGFTIQSKAAGAGWVFALSTTSSAFSWNAVATFGGTSPSGSVGPNEGSTISIAVGVQGTPITAPGLAYTPGSAAVSLATPLNSGTNLQVEYTRSDGDVIEVEDTALVAALAIVTHGTGKYQQITDASSGLIASSPAAGLLQAQQALAAYSVAPQALQFDTYVPGLQPGMFLAVALTLPTGSTALLNGNWVVEEITAELVQVDSTGSTPWLPGFGHYRYTVHLVNIQEIASYLDFWEGMSGGSSGGGAGSGIVEASGGGLATGAATVLVKYTQSWTAETSVTVAHHLGTTAVLIQVYDGSGLQTVPLTATVTDANTVTLTFATTFTGAVVVIG